jgi:hypothetical protein
MTTLASDDSRTARSAGLREVLRTRIELWIAVVSMALAFAAGIAVSEVSQTPSPAAAVTSTDTTTTFPFAPALTDQQIEQGLPSGHPEIGATQPSASGGGSATRSEKSTKSGGADGTGS